MKKIYFRIFFPSLFFVVFFGFVCLFGGFVVFPFVCLVWFGLAFLLLLYKVTLPPSALAGFNSFDFSVKEYKSGEDAGFRQTAQGLPVAGEGSALSLGCRVGL